MEEIKKNWKNSEELEKIMKKIESGERLEITSGMEFI